MISETLSLASSAELQKSFHHSMKMMRQWLGIHTSNPSVRAYGYFTYWRSTCNTLIKELERREDNSKTSYYTESALQQHGIPYAKVNGIPHIIL